MSQLHNEKETLDETIHSASPEHGSSGGNCACEVTGMNEQHQNPTLSACHGLQSSLGFGSIKAIDIDNQTLPSSAKTSDNRRPGPDDPTKNSSSSPTLDPLATDLPSRSQTVSYAYPEGGLRAWLVVLGSFSGMTACFGLLNTNGTFQAYLSSHQLSHLSPDTIGWIFSLYIFLSFFCGVQIGPVFDAKGPRWLVIAGTICLVGGVFGVAESTSMSLIIAP